MRAKKIKTAAIVPVDQKQKENLLYKVREARSNEKPVLVILMHESGANEDDLSPISQSFPENYIVITPQAPFKIGSEHYQWYTNEKSKEGNPGANDKSKIIPCVRYGNSRNDTSQANSCIFYDKNSNNVTTIIYGNLYYKEIINTYQLGKIISTTIKKTVLLRQPCSIIIKAKIN